MQATSQLTITGPDLRRALEVEFIRCPHCGKQIPVRASMAALAAGRPVLGFCGRCDHPTCPECTECVPLERQLDNIEAGRPRLTPSPAFAAIPRAIEG